MQASGGVTRIKSKTQREMVEESTRLAELAERRFGESMKCNNTRHVSRLV